MRTPRKITVAAAMVLAALPAVAPPASAGTSAGAPYQYRAYHGLNHLDSYRRDKFIRNTHKTLRPVAISVGLQDSQERYAMFWDSRPGPQWLKRVVNATGATGGYTGGYQRLFDQLTSDGYQPSVVSATGSGSAATFAAIFEKKAGTFVARHGISAGEFEAISFDMLNTKGFIPVSVNVYGTASDPRYVAVWVANPAGVAWNYTLSVPASAYQSRFDDRVRAGYRPSVIAVGPDGKTYSTVWVKDGIRTWYAFHGMSAAQYQKRFDEMAAKGLYPVSVDMENGVYAAVFTAR
ncbi:hypothetical protein IL992_18970 [Microbispora sp. NEAU-D428]|uniref:hypothetical protein n=1 Tax=Microbispora sitophila TaxID=2771537 RepID=UPI001868215F|nr:hypothetical protein [Microbispora sitophila]MBE3011262.1 hypothetical protein [Microbispora sitophila]